MYLLVLQAGQCDVCPVERDCDGHGGLPHTENGHEHV